MKWALSVGGLLAAVGVIMGAIGAHAAEGDDARRAVQMAAQYQLIHSMGLILSAVVFRKYHFSGILFTIGIFFFSGGIYLSHLVSPLADLTIASKVTPAGGMAFILGWIVFSLSAFKARVE